MSQDSFIFNFNVKEFETAQEFPKSNVVELEGSKWYLGIEKKGISDRITLCYWKILDICLSCDRGTPNGIYLVNLALILKGSLIDVLFTRTYYFKPLDLEMHCFKIEYNYLLDNDNGFIDENGEGKIMAEISVKCVDGKEILELDVNQQELSTCPQELNGIINLQGGHRMLVNKELLSRHSKYFDNIFNNENFVESSQESIDLTDFTYNQFRLLHKHIYEIPAQFTDGSLEYRLKSKDGVKEFQRIWTLDDVREYCQRRSNLPIQNDSRKTYSKENLAVFDDLEQMAAYTGFVFCLFTDYLRREDRTVSEEYIEDLLSVGSYFQVSKILDRCREFLSSKTSNPDFSVRRRLELAEKYNLTSVTLLAMNLDNAQICDADEKTHDIFVNDQVFIKVTFLDTGDEEMCSLKYINGMAIHTLFSNALVHLYFKQICDNPLNYEIESVNISDLETSSEVKYQRKDIDDNPALMSIKAQFDRIYSFEVRRMQGEDSPGTDDLSPSTSSGIGQQLPKNESTGTDDLSPSTSSATAQQLLTVQPAFQFSIPNEEYPISEETPLASTIEPSTSNPISFSSRKSCAGSSVLVCVTFLDTGSFLDTEICTVPYRNAMTIKGLFNATLSNIYIKDPFRSALPWDYKIERVRISIPDSTSEDESEDTFLDFGAIMFRHVLPSQIYTFEVRQKTKQGYLGSKEMPTTSKMPPAVIKNFNRKPTEIVVVVTLLDIDDQKMFKIPYKAGMSVQNLLFIALLFTTLKGSRSYEIENVYASDSYLTSGDEYHSFDIPVDVISTVNSSYAYSFEMRQKTDEPSTSKEKQ